MSIVWFVVSFIGLFMLAGLIGLTRGMRRAQRELKALKSRLDSVGSDLNALCCGAVGVDRRITNLENQGRRLDHRQESLENQKQDERPYGEAIQQIHKGATVDSLVEKLGLSRSEAELMVMLHSVRKAS